MHIHFIGIGGIGVSALAKYHIEKGDTVSGSDLSYSEIVKELEDLGARIIIGKHVKKSVPKETKKVIHTAAIKTSNPELHIARERGMVTETYAQAVGKITKRYHTITVSGSHGKSTTTALSALVLNEGYCDPTVIVGTKIKEFKNSNFRSGKSKYLVLEADEWNKSFLHYSPHIAVVTNIDAEHLDTYKTMEGVEKTFTEFLSKVPKNGVIIANADDPPLRRVAGPFGKKVRWYSKHNNGDADLVRRVLRVPGEHNVSNALAALTLGRVLGIADRNILKAFSRFSGCWRRFEFKGIVNGASVFSDYGHHPTEIKATIRAARDRFPLRRVWCVYQPHQFQRLHYLWQDFTEAFDMADRVCVLPVYDVAGREVRGVKHTANSLILAKEIAKRGKNISYVANFKKADKLLREETRSGDVILIMGAGDIYTFADDLTSGVDRSK